RPIYAGNAIQTVQATDAKKVITVRTASFSQASQGPTAIVEAISAAASSSSLATYISDALSTSDRPELTSAKIIISGGRALG
ncbi:electron transfer flavoprotein subunit alpha/FixB family protein, partial [Mycobacterium tuberculosis]|nr:electron transfer flavoprotein subunit alpha/FixB family protein [Mycobacterium tuberculosis]